MGCSSGAALCADEPDERDAEDGTLFMSGAGLRATLLLCTAAEATLTAPLGVGVRSTRERANSLPKPNRDTMAPCMC